jgi:dipeptidyl aminopeptidase/acylaminoacyl peptidase
MRRLFYPVALLAITIACTQNETKQNMIKPDEAAAPKLTSDIMTPEVLWSFRRLSDATVSPDKKTVLFSLTSIHIEENKSYRDLYTIPVSGGKPTKITDTPEKESGAAWRPDGKKIGYLSSKSGATQLWEMNPDGTEPTQVSNIEGGITGFLYSPDMKHIAYTRDIKLEKDIHDLFPDLPKANARLENDLMYRHWDSWQDYTHSHVFIAPYENGKIGEGKDIMDGEMFDAPDRPFDGIEQLAWSPDGKTLAYTSKKLTGKAYAISTNVDIYMYNLESGETRNFTEGMMGYDKHPVFSPNGKYLAWESMERDGYESDKVRLFVADLETGKKTDYSANFDQNSNGLSWASDSKSIYFISDIHATEEIYKLNLADGSIQRLTDGTHDFRSVEEADGCLIAMKESMSYPVDIYKVDAVTGKDEQLTTVNKAILDQLTLAQVEKRWVKTTDNKEMLVWVIYPPHFDASKKYPAILYCQGGPQGTVSQFWSYRWNFQMMAANGYIVVAPNRRGLPGFGQEWLEQISKDYGGQNIQDYLSAIDNVASEPFVDNDHLGAVGASYGGFSVYYLAGHHNKRFKAFIAHDGIFNFEQQYSTTEEMWFANWDLGGAYWDKANAAAQRSYSFSPHKFVEKWDTPILVMHGEKDYRVPVTQGMGAFNAARMRDIPAQFLYFPEENHWVLQPQNGILWQRVFKQWLDKWLKSE